jgi:hypothetical protein
VNIPDAADEIIRHVMPPALFMGFATKSALVAIIALTVALAHAWLLGFPIVILLQKCQWFHWWLVIATGMLVGGVPSAVCSWPYFSGNGSGYSARNGTKMVAYIVHGEPTWDGWKMYIESVAYMAIWGAASALGYWSIWRFLTRLQGSDAGG